MPDLVPLPAVLHGTPVVLPSEGKHCFASLLLTAHQPVFKLLVAASWMESPLEAQVFEQNGF